MRQKYDGYKSTFGQQPEPGKKKGGGKWGFICLTITCLVLAAVCFTVVGQQAYTKNEVKRAERAKVTAALERQSVKRAMTTFPEVVSRMPNYRKYTVSGLTGGETAGNGDYFLTAYTSNLATWTNANGWTFSPRVGANSSLKDGDSTVVATSSAGTSQVTVPVTGWSNGITVKMTKGDFLCKITSAGSTEVVDTYDLAGNGFAAGYLRLGIGVSDTNYVLERKPSLNYSWRIISGSNFSDSSWRYISNTDESPFPVEDATWTKYDFGTDPLPVVEGDTTPPTYDSSETTTDGTKVLVTLTEADSPPVLPATGVTGFKVKVNRVTRTVTSGTASGLVVTLPIPAKIYKGDTVTVEYDDVTGNVEDSASNAMASFTAKPVTNSSTVDRVYHKPVVMMEGRQRNLPAGEQLIQPAVVPMQTLTDAATVVWDVSDSPTSKAVVTLGGNRTLSITNALNGSQGILFVKQDATGGRTLTLPAGSKVVSDGSGAVLLSTAANAVDAIAFVFDGVSYYFTKGLMFS